MTEFTVNITSRPIGVRFAHFDDKLIGVHEIKPKSIGAKLGLLPGDVLISINNDSVLDIDSSAILNLFRLQQLPFTATFERFHADYESTESDQYPAVSEPDYLAIDNEDDDDDNAIMNYINSNSSARNKQQQLTMDEISTNYDDNDSDYDAASECSLSMQFLDTNSYQTYTQQSNNNKSSNTMIIKRFPAETMPLSLDHTSLKLSVSDLLRPATIQASVDPKCANNKAMDFVFMDDEDEASDIGISTEYEDIDLDTKNLVNGYIRNAVPDQFEKNGVDLPHVLVAKFLFNNTVIFDKRIQININSVDSKTESIDSTECDQPITVITTSNGFYYGIHEWSIKIIKCDVNTQEIGVISNNDLDDIKFDGGGIKETKGFNARAVYGNELLSGNNYYASYNDNGDIRCFKDLSKMDIHTIGWCTGDVIKVCLNLKKGTIRFYLNDKKVRKVISLQKNKMYYPVLAFSGNFEYELIDYK